MTNAARSANRKPRGQDNPSVRQLPIDVESFERAVAKLALSPRQALIVDLLLRGMRDKQIAAELGSRVPTVRTHMARMFQRLGVADRVELILLIVAAAREPSVIECREA